MATSDEFFVVKPKDGVVGIEEIGVEDDLDAVLVVVEEFHTTDLAENRVIGIVGHVVRCHGWKGVAL